MSGLVILGLAASVAGLVGSAVQAGRRRKAIQALVAQITETDQPLFVVYSYELKFRVQAINGPSSSWRPFVIAVTPDQINLYPAPSGERTVIPAARLRWFGRPKKYTSGPNELWLHAEDDGGWRLVRLRLYRDTMQALIRALKEIATPEQVIAYRRQRPYVHFGPVQARPATQDIHGVWALAGPVDLYLMPLFLVLMQGASVQRTIPLETVQQVSAIRRIDQPRADGLVRFEAGGETLAFALKPHEAFATALAEAAKRTLEDPVQWQRKKKKPDDDEDFE
jgi:hypothetical protein